VTLLFNKVKAGIANLFLQFFSVEEKLGYMFLDTSRKNLRPIVILPAVNASMKSITGKLRKKKLHGIVCNGILNNVEVSVIQTHVGSPGTALIMETLKNSACKAVIRIDFCGGLKTTGSGESVSSTGIEIGSVVIPNTVFLSDGNSLQYLQKYAEEVPENPLFQDYPVNSEERWNYPNLNGHYWAVNGDEKLHKIYMNLIPESKKREMEDRLWSSDSLFCETNDAINTWKLHGCNCVDMESCAIYMLGALFNIPVVSLLGVSNLNDDAEFSSLTTNKIHPGVLQGLDDISNLLCEGLPQVQRDFVEKN